MKLGSFFQKIIGVCSIFMISALAAFDANAAEIPIFLSAESKAKVLFLLDDSASMNQIIEHPDYIEFKKNGGTIPWPSALPFMALRIESGPGEPTANTPIKIAYTDFVWNWQRHTGSGYAGDGIRYSEVQRPVDDWAGPASLTVDNFHQSGLMNALDCDDREEYSGNPGNRRLHDEAPYDWTRRGCFSNLVRDQYIELSNPWYPDWQNLGIKHPQKPSWGVFTMLSFRDPNKHGGQIFPTPFSQELGVTSTTFRDYLERTGGAGSPIVRDSDGHEYLFITFRNGWRIAGCNPRTAVYPNGYTGPQSMIIEPGPMAQMNEDFASFQLAFDGGNGGGGGSNGGWVPPPPACEREPLSGINKLFSMGGKIVFNNKEIELGSGEFTKAYLQWIFYLATPDQIKSLPTDNRLVAAKKAIKKVITDNPRISFAVDTFNRGRKDTSRPGVVFEWVRQGHPAKLVNAPLAPFGIDQAELMARLDSVIATRETPLFSSLVNSYNYLATGVDWRSETTITGSPPVNESCSSTSVILLSDGEPYQDWAASDVKLKGSFIYKYMDGNFAGPSNSGCGNWDNQTIPCNQYLRHAAWYVKNVDQSSAVGNQTIKTGVIGFTTTFDLLDEIAGAGGTGTSYFSGNSDSLVSAMNSLISSMIVSSSSGAAVQASEAFGESGRVYRARLAAADWSGYVDSFKIAAGGVLTQEWEANAVLRARPSSSPRTIIAGYDADEDGKTTETKEFTVANAAAFRPLLFKNFLMADPPELIFLPEVLKPVTAEASAVKLIEFVHGFDQTGLRVRKSPVDKRAGFGDIVYSAPVEVGQRNGNYTSMAGYLSFLDTMSTQPKILLFGGNDGMLHALDATTGKELWAYIPSSVIPSLEKLARRGYNSTFRKSYVDGPIGVEDAWVPGKGWRTLAMFGLRTGGSTYTVLDITDRAKPTLLWEVNEPLKTGQSWSKPTIIPVGGGSSGQLSPASLSWYMGVGQGASTFTGTGIVLFKLGTTVPTGTRLALRDADPKGSRTSDVSAVRLQPRLGVTRLYVGTSEGDMYRVKIESGKLPPEWDIKHIFKGSANRPLLNQPVTVLADNPRFTGRGGESNKSLAIGVFIGSGKYDVRSDIENGVNHRIFGIFDPVDPTADSGLSGLITTTLDDSHLQQQDPGTGFESKYDPDKIYRLPNNKYGFYIKLETEEVKFDGSKIRPPGIILSPAVNHRGVLLFSSYLFGGTNSNQCTASGSSYLIAVDYRTGGGVISDYTNPARPEFNGGVPNLNSDSSRDQKDLVMGYDREELIPVLDTNGDNKVGLGDVALGTGGVIYPAVSKLATAGFPTRPSILTASGIVLAQTSEVGAPTFGEPKDLNPGEFVPPPNTSLLDPPSGKKIQLLGPTGRVLTFNEVTDKQ